MVCFIYNNEKIKLNYSSINLIEELFEFLVVEKGVKTFVVYDEVIYNCVYDIYKSYECIFFKYQIQIFFYSELYLEKYKDWDTVFLCNENSLKEEFIQAFKILNIKYLLTL